MKKTMAIAALLVVAATFTSCKKEYTCECVTESGGIKTTTTSTIKDTKKKATDACESLSKEVAGVKTTCSIK